MALACVLMVGGWGAGTSFASNPPGPGPYGHIDLQGSGPPEMRCTDAAANVVYDAPAWTLEPLLRGPLFAPTVLFLDGDEDRAVVPLRFTSTAYPIIWSTADGGPSLGGTIESISGRPVGYGPTPTSNAPMVTCSYSLLGHSDFGTFRITRALRAQLGLPAATVGRTLAFDGEGIVSFEVRADQFPPTASYDSRIIPWLVPDDAAYSKISIPAVTCVQDGKVLFRGTITTLAPLVRGYQWAPIAFWLPGDRIVTPHWSKVTINETWETLDATPARSGTIATNDRFSPTGVGANPWPTSKVVDCSWGGPRHEVLHVTPYMLGHLNLPSRVVDHDIQVDGSTVTHAYIAAWLFPPSS